jgi:hypothetical protein
MNPFPGASTRATRWQLCAAGCIIGLTLALVYAQPVGAQNFGTFSLAADNFTSFVYPDD